MIKFENTYTDLPEILYSSEVPDTVQNPELLAFNKELASDLGIPLSDLDDKDLAMLFSGQMIPDGASSVALAYAGHQFGHFVPQLGDGRAMLLGEVKSPQGKQYDVQLKGSGRTNYSRGGDGKSSLGPVVREYIVSEAMHFLGVPTTRALAAVSTGENVYREQPLPGGVFTRVASSHIRVGTFEFLAARGENDSIRLLVEYCIQRHFPHIANEEDIILKFLHEVAKVQSKMVAHWLSLGFIHGVMNTDNMSISGETLDFGPCAFIDNFSRGRVFSSIDKNGRYSYGNQINIAKWNLSRLASCLIPLIGEDEKEAITLLENSINSYLDIYESDRLTKMIPKFGLFESTDKDSDVVEKWLDYLESEDLDFTNSFRALSGDLSNFKKTPLFDQFHELWTDRLSNQAQDLDEARALMNSSNPIYIPRNHQVERAIQASLSGDHSVMTQMNELLKRPFIEQTDFEEYKKAPLENERVTATFCGT